MASTDAHFSRYRNKLRKLSIKLSITHEILPSALILKGVQCDSTHSIDAGGFGDVYIGTYNGIKVALKHLRTHPNIDNEVKQLFYRETLLWKDLMNAHIIQFLGITEDLPREKQICMVIPWMANGSLKSFVAAQRKKGALEGDGQVVTLDKWLYQISDGLAYLHAEGIVHGDLHGGNVLIDQNETACLTDFGMALVAESTPYAYNSRHGGGALHWNAPELSDPEHFGLETRRPTFQSDVFSFACVCVEVYTGAPPFHKFSPIQAAGRYVMGQRPDRPTLPGEGGGLMPDALWSLTNACWAQNPWDRISTKEATSTMAQIARIPADTFMDYLVDGDSAVSLDARSLSYDTIFDIAQTMIRDSIVSPSEEMVGHSSANRTFSESSSWNVVTNLRPQLSDYIAIRCGPSYDILMRYMKVTDTNGLTFSPGLSGSAKFKVMYRSNDKIALIGSNGMYVNMYYVDDVKCEGPKGGLDLGLEYEPNGLVSFAIFGYQGMADKTYYLSWEPGNPAYNGSLAVKRQKEATCFFHIENF
ncbi:hypothetical protein EUX98_g3127 [Antrodiella citrinella]|uniref:Protein kinase domain-containing protein n=1 Tax=Antrodiella citrinella TaxID=2447956 RepID=A0A4S4MXC0_9APHY|nr:hypothetical protein EUX98_g3127 [Antrodiella citrinella]